MPVAMETATLTFERCIVESVEEALSSLGELPKQTILLNLEKHFGVKLQDIPNNFAAFDGALKKIFGANASLLEGFILRRLDKEVGLTFEELQLGKVNLEASVAALRQRMAVSL